MTHYLKTSQLFRAPLCLMTRCLKKELNIIHRANQCVSALCGVPAPLDRPRQLTSLSAQPVPTLPPPHHLVPYMEQLSRQLTALQEVHRLQSSADWRQLTHLPLTEYECQAFASPPSQLCAQRTDPAGTLDAQGADPPDRQGTDPPGAEDTQSADNRPTPDQLQAVEANLLNNLPKLFVMTQDFSIYHQDLVFDNRIRGTRTVGIVPYIKQCALLRVVGHIKFSFVTFDILQSSTHPEDGSVRVRWRIRGVSALRSMLLFWKFNVFNPKKNIDQLGVDWYDGYSVFYVGGDGRIHTHVADKMMPDWDREVDRKRTALNGLAARLAAASGVVSAPELSSLLSLTSRLEELERQIHTALPLSLGAQQGTQTGVVGGS